MARKAIHLAGKAEDYTACNREVTPTTKVTTRPAAVTCRMCAAA